MIKLFLATILILISLVANAEGVIMNVVDIEKIISIESGGKTSAYNKKEGAIGLCQIRPCVLKEYNRIYKPITEVKSKDLFEPDINKAVANWYLNVRIPQLLEHFHKPVTVRNMIICYNAGIKYVANGLAIPNSTARYLKKYFAK